MGKAIAKQRVLRLIALPLILSISICNYINWSKHWVEILRRDVPTLAFTTPEDSNGRLPGDASDGVSSTVANDDGDTAGQYRILMLHYHKTGFVLSRQLRSHAVEHFATPSRQPETFRIPEKSWGSIQLPRHHEEGTNCPGVFRLEGGTINVQESPDFYCDVEEMARVLLDEDEVAKTRGTKIVHFVRDPLSMALSNYYYHSQDPCPEKWEGRHRPCVLEYANRNSTLRDLLFPTLSDSGIMKEEDFDQIAGVCRSLFQTKPGLGDSLFDEHLHELEAVDGLKLSTSQMMIRGGGQMLRPGGDMLRMANNLIKLRELETYVHSNHVVGKNHSFALRTVSMDSFISDPAEFATAYFDFLLDDTDTRALCPKRGCPRKVSGVANDLARKYQEMNDRGASNHVTSGRSSDKEKMKAVLQSDPLFGPILDRVGKLVNEALESSSR